MQLYSYLGKSSSYCAILALRSFSSFLCLESCRGHQQTEQEQDTGRFKLSTHRGKLNETFPFQFDLQTSSVRLIRDVFKFYPTLNWASLLSGGNSIDKVVSGTNPIITLLTNCSDHPQTSLTFLSCVQATTLSALKYHLVLIMF